MTYLPAASAVRRQVGLLVDPPFVSPDLKITLECGPMPNVMAALPNIRGARKVWLAPTTTEPCSNAAKTRNPLKFAGVPQTRQQISPVSGQISSPYCGDLWRRYCCATSFLIRDLVAEIWPDKVVRWCADGEFWRPVFPASRVQHVSDLHPKFALRPHYLWKYGTHPICDR